MQRAVFLVMTLAACGSAPKTGDTSQVASSLSGASVAGAIGGDGASAVGSTSTAKPPPTCPADGRWSACAVVERLERAGLVPRQDSASAEEAPLSARGTLLRIGNGQLELYLYPDEAARERDAARLDGTRYLSYQAPISIQPTPTLIQSQNLIAILHSRNAHLRERIGDAITAGPPQPSRTP